MEKLVDYKISITLKGAPIYKDAPFFVSMNEKEIIFKTNVGEDSSEELLIKIEKGN